MTDPKHRVVLIEDEAPIRRFVRATLQAHGYHVDEGATGQAGLAHITTARPDIVILDLGLPDIDGLDITQRIREWSEVPIIILSARGQERDKVMALDAGADDYLTKPFGVEELLARLRVALRHAAWGQQGAGESQWCSGPIRVDMARRQVIVNDVEVHLTPIEYKLLTTLIQHAGKVVTHHHLLKAVWGPAYATETPYLRVYMGNLRKKLEADPARPRYLLTEPGVGYRLRTNDEGTLSRG